MNGSQVNGSDNYKMHFTAGKARDPRIRRAGVCGLIASRAYWTLHDETSQSSNCGGQGSIADTSSSEGSQPNLLLRQIFNRRSLSCSLLHVGHTQHVGSHKTLSH